MSSNFKLEPGMRPEVRVRTFKDGKVQNYLHIDPPNLVGMSSALEHDLLESGEGVLAIIAVLEFTALSMRKSVELSTGQTIEVKFEDTRKENNGNEENTRPNHSSDCETDGEHGRSPQGTNAERSRDGDGPSCDSGSGVHSK